MSKIAVVYWSGSGNTEAMAYAVVDGAVFACEPVICNEMPDNDDLASCKELGAALCK